MSEWPEADHLIERTVRVLVENSAIEDRRVSLSEVEIAREGRLSLGLAVNQMTQTLGVSAGEVIGELVPNLFYLEEYDELIAVLRVPSRPEVEYMVVFLPRGIWRWKNEGMSH